MSHAAIARIWARAGERFQSIITKYERIAEERNDSDVESVDLSQYDDPDDDDDVPLEDAFEKCHAAAVRRPTNDDDDDALELEGNDEDGMLGYFSGRFLEETKSRMELDDSLEALEVDEDDEDDDEDVLLNCGVEDCLLCRAKAAMAQHKPMIVPQVKIEDDVKLRMRPVVILHRLMLPSTPEPLPFPDTPEPEEEAICEVPELPGNIVDSDEEEIQVVECRVRPTKVVVPAIDDRVKSAIRATYQENRSADPDSFVEAVMRTILAAPTKDEPPSPVEVKNAPVTVEAKHLAIVKQRLSPEIGPIRRRRIKQRVSPVPTERIVVKNEPNKAKTERKMGLPIAITPYDSHDDDDDDEELENYFPYPSFAEAPEEEEEEEKSRIALPKPEPEPTPTSTTSSKKRSRRKPMLDWQKATLVEQEKSIKDARRREKKKKIRKEKIADDASSTRKSKTVVKTVDDDDDYFSKTFNLGDSPDTPPKSNQRQKNTRNCATEVKKPRLKLKTKQSRSIRIDFGLVRDESDDFFLSRFVED